MLNAHKGLLLGVNVINAQMQGANDVATVY